jgi:type IV pilus assembly protein PilW
MTDPASLTITGLTYSLAGSDCINSSEPNQTDDDGDGTVDEDDEYDCYVVQPSSGETKIETRQVLITLTAQLAGDPSVQAAMSQTVKVRNNLIRDEP